VKVRAKARLKGAEAPEVPALGPLPQKKPLAKAVESAGVIQIHRNPGLTAPQLSPIDAELRLLFQKISEPLAEPAPEARLGSEGELQDEQVFLDAALAHGNPVSRYIRTLKESDLTKEDSVEIDGQQYPAPRRMRRCVVGHDPKGNYIWALLRDELIETKLTIEKRGAILTWAPVQFNKRTRTTIREYTLTLRYHPSQKLKDVHYVLDRTCERIVKTETRRVAGYFGEENLRNEAAEKLRIAGVKNAFADVFPDTQCTWLVGEDVEKLKKKANRKMWASKNERMANNRSSWAFPSQLSYRPPPKRWWFLRHVDGMSHVYHDEIPWTQGIVAPDVMESLKEHNRRSVDVENTRKIIFSQWIFAADAKFHVEGPDLSSRSNEEKVADTPPALKLVQPERAAVPEKPQHTIEANSVRFVDARWPDITEQLITMAKNHSVAVNEEWEEKPMELEEGQTWIPKSVAPTEPVAFVRPDGGAIITAVPNKRALVSIAQAVSEATPMTPKLEALDSGPAPIVRLLTATGPMDYDISDPDVFGKLDVAFNSIQQRIELLCVAEDVLEEIRESALRRQKYLKDEEPHVRYNDRKYDMVGAPFAQYEAALKAATVRKMKWEDLRVPVTQPGSILYGHRLNRTQGRPARGFKQLCDTIRKMDRSLAKHKARQDQMTKLLAKHDARLSFVEHYRRKKVEAQEHLIAELHDKVQLKVNQARMKQARFKAAKARHDAFIEKATRQRRWWESHKDALKAERVSRGYYWKLLNETLGGKKLRAKRYASKMGRLPLELRLVQEMKLQVNALAEERQLLREVNREKDRIAKAEKERRKHTLKAKMAGVVNRMKTKLNSIKERFVNPKTGTMRDIVEPVVNPVVQEPAAVTEDVLRRYVAPAAVKTVRKYSPKQKDEAQNAAKLAVYGGVVFEQTESGIIIPAPYRYHSGDRLAAIFDKVKSGM
jgi:hypothetical protein